MMMDTPGVLGHGRPKFGQDNFMNQSENVAAGASGIWEKIYASGQKINRYPYDIVVTFVMRRFGRSQRDATRLLDYGCGGGNHAGFMASEGFDLHAIDNAPTAIEITRQVVKDITGSVDEKRITVADFSRLPFPDNYFDAVVDRQSLGQNATSDLPALVDEIHRVLKPGGCYFGVNFSDGHPQLKYGRTVGKGDYADFSEGVFKGLGQKHFFSVAEVQTLFRDFDIESVEALNLRSVAGSKNGSEEFIITALKKG
jgi:ubiquinone/menaquinone biosynthesis C-methylase UbiE